jgi:hypothetical protein
MLLYEVKNIIRIFYEMENELIIHEWLEYNPEDQDNTIILISPCVRIVVASINFINKQGAVSLS